MVDRKEGGWGEEEREGIYELLPSIRPCFLYFIPVPTHHHQLGTRNLRQDPACDISYSAYNIHLHWDPGILLVLFVCFKDKESLRH